jgi:hypothetical protein
MFTNVKAKRGIRIKKLLLTSLLFAVLLISLFSYSFTANVEASPLKETISVETEWELRTAVNNTPHNTPTIITLNKDIALTQTLTIPANKNITLTSKDHNTTFYKLIGASSTCIITVNNGGTLTLYGIIITHEHNYGMGVVVNSGGKLYMHSGKIANNSAHRDDYLKVGGGGVYNNGVFTMYGGTISANSSPDAQGGCGGGISNNGTFSMYGGEISGNTALKNTGSCGGGVYNSGTFTMSSGTISNNKATSESSTYGGHGGGVFTYGHVRLTGGKISGNTATNSGGGISVYNNETSDKLFIDKGVVVKNNYTLKDIHTTLILTLVLGTIIAVIGALFLHLKKDKVAVAKQNSKEKTRILSQKS